MSNFIKRKLLDQNEVATVQDLCTVAGRQLVFFEFCPSDDWTRDAFNEVNSTLRKLSSGNNKTYTATRRTETITGRLVQQYKHPEPFEPPKSICPQQQFQPSTTS